MEAMKQLHFRGPAAVENRTNTTNNQLHISRISPSFRRFRINLPVDFAIQSMANVYVGLLVFEVAV